MSDTRPDADELLDIVAEHKVQRAKGRLKIFLGMAAGVGKTYSMLSNAQEARERGQEIVIGYLEMHGRKETEALAEHLESLPPRVIEHRGIEIKEFDIDSALTRKPEIVLVDELAHTNAPESRHAKRFQDIEELLDAGIGVWTTVNIQHIESLRDVVAQVTGIFVQETVPDSFIERADEIELIDIPPEQLQQRLQDGKIYVPEKIEQALQGFFKKGNLLALRELALRQTAERVDQELRKTRSLTKTTEPWHASERILVCVAPSRMASKVVRAARRLANSLHADLLAVTVASSRQAGIGTQAQAEMDAAMRLAEELGAKTTTLAGDDIVAELIAYAQQENVTTIVMGKPVRQRWKEIVFGSVVDHTVRSSGNIDVLIITGDEASGTPLRRSQREGAWSIKGIAETILLVALATVIGHFIGNEVRHANIIMLYLLGTSIVSVRHTRREAMLSAVLAVTCFNFFFVPPIHTFAVSDVQNVLTFAVMLAVALMISSLTSRLKEHSRAASDRERNTAALYDLSKKLAGTRSKTEMAQLAIDKIRSLVGADSAVLRISSAGLFGPLVASDTGFESTEKEQAVARWVVDHGKPAGASTDTLSGAEGFYLPLAGSEETFGAFAVQLGDRELDTSSRHLIEAVGSLLSTALERAFFAKASHVAALKAETERLRGDLLSSVSHDLRTPLASILGAASILKSNAEATAKQQDLASVIVEESERMSRLVQNLLDMTRIRGSIDLNYDWHNLEEIVNAAILRTESLFDHPVSVEVEGGQLLVRADGVLFEQVIVNLLENASRHAGRDAHVQVTIRQAGWSAQLDVIDDGPGIPEEVGAQVFERYRGRSSAGFGLGLAICKAAVEAHQGRISIVPTKVGADFRIEFPLEPAPTKSEGRE